LVFCKKRPRSGAHMVRISLKNTFLSLSFEEEEEAPKDKRNGRSGREGDATFRSQSADSAWPCRTLELLPECAGDATPKRGINRVSQLENLNRLLKPEPTQQTPEFGTSTVDAPETQEATTVSPSPRKDDGAEGSPPAARCRSRRQLRIGSFPLPPGLVERKPPSAMPGCFESSEEATSCSDSTGSTRASEQTEAGVSPSRQNCRARRPPWTPPKVNQFPKEYRHVHVPKHLDLEEEYRNSHQNQPPTTLMIRNIPNRYTQRELITELEDLGFAGSFNFLYLPLDKGTMANVGYAFVNFLESCWAERCMAVFHDYCFRRHRRHSRKVAAVSVAHIQGLEANLAHYESAAVNTAKLKQRRPLVVANISHTVNMAGYGGHWHLPPPR